MHILLRRFVTHTMAPLQIERVTAHGPTCIYLYTETCMCVCERECLCIVLPILTYICTVITHPHIGYTNVHANAHTVVCIFMKFIVTPICVLKQLKYIHTLLSAQQSTYIRIPEGRSRMNHFY